MAATIGEKVLGNYYYRCARKAAIKRNTGSARIYMDRALNIDPGNSIYVLGDAIITGLGGKYKISIDRFAKALQLLENSNLRTPDRDYLMAFAAHSASHYEKKMGDDTRYRLFYEEYSAKVKFNQVSLNLRAVYPAPFMENWKNPGFFEPTAGLLDTVNRRALFELLSIPFLSAVISYGLYGKLHIAVTGLFLGWALYYVYLRDQRKAKTFDPVLFAIIPSGLIVTYLISPEFLKDNVIASITLPVGVLALERIWSHIKKQELIRTNVALAMAAAGAWTGFFGAAAVLVGGVIVGLIYFLQGNISSKSEPILHWPVAGFLAISLMLVWLYWPAIPKIQL